MSHERKRSVRQAITTGPHPSGTESIGRRKALVGEFPDPSRLGTGEVASPGQDLVTSVTTAQRPQIFNFDAQGIRVVGTPEEPWFVAKDICGCLGLGGDRVSSSVASLEEDEKGSDSIATLGGEQEMLIVNESGLYALIFRSRRPEARLFRRWVTGEVLPAIRRTGTYAIPAPGSRSMPTPPPSLPGPPVSSRPVPTLVDDVGHLLDSICAGRSSCTVRGPELADRAYHLGLYAHALLDPLNRRQVAHFCRHLVNYLGHWIPLPGTPVRYIGFTAIGRNRHRRYKVTRWVQEGRP